MAQMLLLGDEALAMGAIDAGMSIAYGYPGTPSTEIIEFLQNYTEKNENILARWCTNEKTSFEGAVGVSYTGKRVLVTMKHVGLNVAADAFINSALVKINGGLVVAVADDPGMHSSQNEQDSRFYAEFARIICLEPRNHQETYEMTIEAFELSEKYNIPVMIRLVTRLSHSRAAIITGQRKEQNILHKAENKLDWMTLPALSRKNWEKLMEAQNEFALYSENTAFNKLEINNKYRKYGVITTGIAGNYYIENTKDLQEIPSHLHIGVYPVPTKKINKLASKVDRLIVIEEGYPYVEKVLRGILPEPIPIDGKMNRVVPITGELNPENVRKAIGLSPKIGISFDQPILPDRPPQLCNGCPHKDSFDAINKAISSVKKSIVTSDIGCYALGALPPYSAVEVLLCMGASIGMAKGAVDAGHKNVIATIGDSTFLHSGIPALIDASSANTNMTLIILDNSTTAMTGGQDTILTSLQIETLVQGIGIDPDHLKVMIPLGKYTERNTEIIKNEVEYKGLSVIIARRECIQTIKKKKGKCNEK